MSLPDRADVDSSRQLIWYLPKLYRVLIEKIEWAAHSGRLKIGFPGITFPEAHVCLSLLEGELSAVQRNESSFEVQHEFCTTVR